MVVQPADAASAIAEPSVRFDARVYALPTIKKAAYRFLKTFVANISREGDAWLCSLALMKPLDESAVRELVRDFEAEVLDQDLRAAVARETEGVRNTILALAFSRTGLQGQ